MTRALVQVEFSYRWALQMCSLHPKIPKLFGSWIFANNSAIQFFLFSNLGIVHYGLSSLCHWFQTSLSSLIHLHSLSSPFAWDFTSILEFHEPHLLLNLDLTIICQTLIPQKSLNLRYFFHIFAMYCTLPLLQYLMSDMYKSVLANTAIIYAVCYFVETHQSYIISQDLAWS